MMVCFSYAPPPQLPNLDVELLTTAAGAATQLAG
jgi:hypothetical protein